MTALDVKDDVMAIGSGTRFLSKSENAIVHRHRRQCERGTC